MFSFDFTKRNRADDVIDTLIELVLTAYPPERLERIRSRSDYSWNSPSATHRYSDRISYVVMNYSPPVEPQIPDDASGIQAEMINQLKMILHNSIIDDEYYPGFSSGLEQVAIPSMFKCVKEIITGSDRVNPVISTPDDVYSLPAADLREGYICYDLLYRMAYKYQRTGGRIPVYMTDVQGPLSCAAQMWGIERFLGDMYEFGEQAHFLLNLCTDAIIKYFGMMYSVTEGNLIPIHCHPIIWVPRDCGVAVSDDFFAIMGKDAVEEFSLPYLDRIGETFGGVTVHTCGSMNHLPELINTMKTIRAVNFGSSETDVEKYAAECDPRITLIVHKSGLSCNSLPLLDTRQHLKLCAEVQKNTGVKVFATPQYTGEPLNDENLAAWEQAARLE